MRTWERRTNLILMALALAFLAAYAYPIIYPDAPRPSRPRASGSHGSPGPRSPSTTGSGSGSRTTRPGSFGETSSTSSPLSYPRCAPCASSDSSPLLKVFNRSAATHLRGKVALYVAGGSTLLGFIAALAVLDAERSHPDANIITLPDAIWWTAVTMTTVGYGDRFPVTPTGRAIALGLMIGGIALLGTVTATLASWLSDRVRVESAAQADPLLDEIRALRAEVAELRQRG